MSPEHEILSQVNQQLGSMAQEVARLRSEVARSREELAAIRLSLDAPEQQLIPFAPPSPQEQLVSLNQMAAIVRRQKDSMRYYRDEMPPPKFKGRRGQKALWVWAEVRPWLQLTFGMCLPERFPTLGG